MTPEPGPVSWGWPWGHSAHVPVEKQPSSAILLRTKMWLVSTPVSMTAITVPVPSKPRAQA